MATYGQIYTVLNAIATQAMGGTAITAQDTTSFVSLGDQVLDSTQNIDAFYNALPDVIGRIVSRYQSIRRRTRDIEVEPLDFGIALLEIETDTIARAKKNNTWDSSIDPFTLMLADDTAISASIYSVMSGWEVNKLIYDRQLKTAFHNEMEMASFINMVFADMYNGMTLAQNDADRMCEAVAIMQELYAANAATPKHTAVNLIKAYNTAFNLSGGAAMTAANSHYDKDFKKWAALKIKTDIENAEEVSNLYNPAGAERELEPGDFRIHMLSEFASEFAMYLEADTYHNEFVKMPEFSKVASWQGKGTSDSFADRSTVSVINDDMSCTIEGVVCHVFAKGRMLTTIKDIRTKSMYNAIDERTIYAHKADIGYAVRPKEIGIVYYIADTDWAPEEGD